MLNHSVSGSLHPDFDWRIICEEHDSVAVLETVEYGLVLCLSDFFVWRQFAVFVDIDLMVY